MRRKMSRVLFPLLILIYASLLSSKVFATGPQCYTLLKSILDTHGGGGSGGNNSFQGLYAAYTQTLDSIYERAMHIESLGQQVSYESIPEPLFKISVELINKLDKELKAAGVNTKIVMEKLKVKSDIGDLVIPYPTINLNLLESDTTYHSLLAAKQIQKRLGITNIIIDPFTPFQEEFRAAYSNDTVIVSMQTFIDGFLDNKLGTTMMHEFNHAMFEKMRTQGKRSIFSALYSGKLDRYSKGDGYDSFLSCEELYTFGRQAFNNAQELPRQFTANNINLYDTDPFFKSLIHLNLVARKTKAISTAVIDKLRELMNTDELLVANQFILQNDVFPGGTGFVIQLQDGTHFVAFLDNDKENLANSYLKTAESLIKFMKSNGIENPQEILFEGKPALNFKDETSNTFVNKTYNKMIKQQKALIASIIKDHAEYNQLSQRLYNLSNSIVNEVQSLAILKQSILKADRIDQRLLDIFNERYLALRINYRAIAVELIETMKTTP